MKGVNPYLNFPGNTEEAFNFYKSVFGGEFGLVARFGDSPDNSMGVADADLDKIAHIALPLGPHGMLMGTDHVDSMPQKFSAGNNFSLTVAAETAEEAEDIFDALAAGGQVAMPLAPTEWAEKYGMCTDKFGVQWMVNYEGSVQFAGTQEG